ncbi:MAG: HlyC/CorC family transporter [Clostridia bacterium]|nr:HlyC/CorC family transporter [Clostridia bacterium]
MDSSPSPLIRWLSEEAANEIESGNFRSVIGLIVFFFVLLLGGAYFAGAETSLASVNRIRIMSRADNGSKRAKRVLYILDHFDEALTTILIGNNIMHIGSASLTALVAVRLNWGSAGATATSLVTTLLVFLLAEMIPKTIAKACNESFALFVAPSLRLLMRILYPLNFVFTSLTNGVKKLFRVQDEEEPTVSEEELHDIIETLDEEDDIDEDTADLMQSALDFTETPVGEIFVPLENVETVTLGMHPTEIVKIIEQTNHSRLPVKSREGEICGVVQIRKYLKEYLRRQGHVSLARVMDKPYYVTVGTPIDEQLAGMSKAKTHIAIVRDNDGKVLGILTVEDILEKLVGEIYDEDDVGGVADE